MSEEMGKNLHHHQEAPISLSNHSPGCMWGIFNHFQHNRWHTVKKRLPRRRHGSGKHSTDQEGTGTTSEAAEMQGNIYPVETKSLEPRPAHKSSMTSRIKALFTEEKSRRRGRHRRSSSCPVRPQLDKTVPIHPIESSDVESPAQSNSNNHDIVHSSALLDPPLPKLTQQHCSNSSCDLCVTMLNMNYLKQSEVNKVGPQAVRDHTLLQDKSIYAIEPSKYAALQESKLYMDALDLLNMRKELFLKILQDRSSSLAHQLQCRRLPNLRLRLSKSVSFPVPGSSDRGGFKSDNSITKQENSSCIKEEDGLQHCAQVMEDFNKHLGSHTENGSPEQFLRELELLDNASPTSAIKLRKRHDNRVALKHFRNLTDKIKNVIRDRKKEKNRIIMDAVHHKIPYGHRVSKDLNSDGHMAPEFKADKFSKYSSGSCGNPRVVSDMGKSPRQGFKRTTSFNESFDRYNRLLEVNSNRETKDQVPERLNHRTADRVSLIPRKPATLVRILSLPDLRSYSSIQIDDCGSTTSLHTPDMTASGNTSVASICLTEQRPLCLASENKIQPFALSESGSQENLLDVGETFDDSADSKTWESASSHDFNIEPGPSSDPQPSKPDQVSENDSNYQEGEIGQGLALSVSEDLIIEHGHLFATEEDFPAIPQDLSNLDSSIVSENKVGIDILESHMNQLYENLLHVEVGTKNAAEFNYVKDILELSGFSRNEILGKWHSAEHPVDPLLFDEMEGCLVAQPEYSGYEEGLSCDHLLLFDLINDVLLDIYERSFCYWPMPLTSQSRMHRMPKGHRVLEEVWAEIGWLLRWRPENDQAIDDAVSRDLAKPNGWMNLQFDAECVGLELEDLIFDDLLEEMIST